MRQRRPSPAMVVAVIALILSLAGTGVAGVTAITSLSKSEKKQTRKIAGNEIEERAPNLSVKSAERAQIADFAATAGAANSAGFASSAMTSFLGGIGRSDPSVDGCNPESITFIECSSVTLSVPAPTRVLVIGTARWSGAANSQIACSLSSTSGQVPDSSTTSTVRDENLALAGMTDALPAGTHGFSLDCAQFTIADAFVITPKVTAVALSAN